MKLLNKFLLLAMLSVVFACNSDDEELAGQEYKPTVSITASAPTGNVDEGTSITYSLSFDKPINHPISFVATLVSGVAGANDVELGVTTIPANVTTGSLTVDFIADLVPELPESAVIKIEGGSEDSKYYINPASQLPNYTYSIISPVSATDLAVALEWDYDTVSDIDLYAFSEANGPWELAATGDTPEVKNIILGSEPDGTYLLGIDAYSLTTGVETGVTSFDYNFIFGTPDGSVTNVSGTYDYENQDATYDVLAWPSNPVTFVYILLEVEKTGTNYVFTQL